jgi:hypothetical protein
MKKQEILEILRNVSFAPSNLDMGWEWDVKESKIYDGSVVVEKGFCIRTTFMRPDANTGEIEKGYGRWMYIPENISTDGLVKTAWVCAELIVKHELMEAFLYEKKRIFDPHKSIKDLQESGNSNILHDQNINNHTSEISDWLGNNFKKVPTPDDINRNIDNYDLISHKVTHSYKDKPNVVLSNSNGKIIKSVSGENYTLSNVKEMLDSYLKADPGEINALIIDNKYKEVRTVDGAFIYNKPGDENHFLVHQEGTGLALLTAENRILKSTGDMEGGYTKQNVQKILNEI